MGIKNIINSEIREFITESLNKNIINNNFTTALSEDGDVVANIVNSELNSDNCVLEENILTEGLSNILYHFTYIPQLQKILKVNKFATSSNLGSNADQLKDKGKYFLFSTQRTKCMSGYGSHHGNVAIVLDGRKLNYNFKGFATDYWNWSKKRSDYSNVENYNYALQSGENEDRIVTNKPYIDNANQYIIEIHILINPDQVKKESLAEIILLCKNFNINIFFYLDDNSFKLQNKLKAVDPNSFNLESKEVSAYSEKEGERDLYYAKGFFRTIAPVIIAGNDNDGYNKERELIEELLKSMLEKGGELDQHENIMQDINEKVKRLSSSWGWSNDEYRSIQAGIDNHRGDPNPYFRKLLKMLINDMKKWGVSNLKEYFNKKF